MTTIQDTPYGNLMTDLLFKKASNPDNEYTKVNLINLINDILAPQLECPVVDVHSRDKEQNASGSHASRCSILDLHCIDSVGRLFSVEIQIRWMEHFLRRVVYYASQSIVSQGVPGSDWDYNFKPTYTIAISNDNYISDDRFVHHVSFCDLETKTRFGGYINFTFIELRKFPGLDARLNSLKAWTYLFKNLHRITKLPDNLKDEKYTRLLEIAKVAKFNRDELEKYRSEVMSLEWDESAVRISYQNLGRKEGREEGLKEGREEGRFERTRELAKGFRDSGIPIDLISRQSGLSEDEIRSL